MPLIERISYAGWANCYRISNGAVELIVTSDVGPRIIRYAFIGGANMFREVPEMLGKSGESMWQSRGGHRLWVAPEVIPVTYALDNGPVEIATEGDVLVATQPVEPETGLQKQIAIRLAAEGSDVEVVHRIRNHTRFPLEYAAWAITVMASGGVAFAAFPPRGSHPEVLAPTNPIAMWAYTNFSDPRWLFTKKHVILRQDPQAANPQKAGLFCEHTWAGYLLGDNLFVKRYHAGSALEYPDYGCSLEMFTNQAMLEIETLGPLTRVAPGSTVEHIETWSLRFGVSIPEWTDAALDALTVAHPSSQNS